MTTTPTSIPAPDARLGSLRGDRPCLGCGFNLQGQTILRDPHYNLLIVRCPECSTVAALQDYPVLGRWARRWGFMLAGAYMVISIVLLLGGGVAAGGFAAVASEQLRNNYCQQIASAHRRWFEANEQPALLAQVTNNPQISSEINNTIAYVNNWGPFAAVNRDWWEKTGRADFRKWLATRPFAYQVDDIAAYSLAAVFSVLGGGLFAVLFPGIRGARLLIIPLTLGVVASLVLFTSNYSWVPSSPLGILANYTAVHNLALEEMPARFPLVVLGGATIGITLGAFIGRPAARTLIRFLLTPRVASAFSFLWDADGRTFRPWGTKG